MNTTTSLSSFFVQIPQTNRNCKSICKSSPKERNKRMFPQVFYFKLLLIFLYRVVLGKLGRCDADRTLRRSGSNVAPANLKYQRFASLVHRNDLSDRVIIFNVECALLRTTSLFPYFMVVAFEAGIMLRAVLLLLLYPIVAVLNEETALKVMVMVSFFGLREDTFRVRSGVLPKHFLEDVGSEVFDVIRKGGKKVGVTNLPNVMVESFLRDYMDVDAVVGRKLKVFHGYYIGVMEEKMIMKNDDNDALLKEIEEDHKPSSQGHRFIGINSGKRSTRHPLFSRCEEMYIVSRGDKKNWHELPKQSYPRPLIFHDGRLAIKPTPSAFLALLMWFPLGLTLSFFRAIVGLFLPYDISIPVLAFSGLRLTVSNLDHLSSRASSDGTTKAGLLYVCNHRTLLDPLYLSFTLKKDFTAVTYSLSRVSEMLSPIRTVRLTRNRQKDAEMMETLLRQGDLVVCPEGTTCREPYLLRFSPLFSEMSDNIVPVALDVSVSMFYGTTASGLKCFDPLFFLMNPNPSYNLRILEKVSGMMSRCHESKNSRFDIANRVQREIGDVLGFECTKLTRKDKYLILAGNEGISKGRA